MPEENLDLLLSFARVVPELAAYRSLAPAHGLRLVGDEVAPEYGLFTKPGFGLMVVDGRIARLHCMGLFEDGSDSDGGAALGIAVTSDCAELRAEFDRVRASLVRRLGAPTREGTWRSTCLLDDDEHDYGFAAWSFGQTILVLLLDDEGDGHIGELTALDLRIAPRSAEDALPDSVREPFGWPVAP